MHVGLVLAVDRSSERSHLGGPVRKGLGHARVSVGHEQVDTHGVRKGQDDRLALVDDLGVQLAQCVLTLQGGQRQHTVLGPVDYDRASRALVGNENAPGDVAVVEGVAAQTVTTGTGLDGDNRDATRIRRVHRGLPGSHQLLGRLTGQGAERTEHGQRHGCGDAHGDGNPHTGDELVGDVERHEGRPDRQNPTDNNGDDASGREGVVDEGTDGSSDDDEDAQQKAKPTQDFGHGDLLDLDQYQ